MEYKDFVRKRLSQLLLQKGISEYRLSRELRFSNVYIHNISSGKTMPSLSALFAICDYFGLTPAEFFTPEISITQKTIDEFNRLNDTDKMFILNLINRMTK